jgi:hypothetical protein
MLPAFPADGFSGSTSAGDKQALAPTSLFSTPGQSALQTLIASSLCNHTSIHGALAACRHRDSQMSAPLSGIFDPVQEEEVPGL